MVTTVQNNTRVRHGNQGRVSNKSAHFNEFVKDDLHKFLDDQQLLAASQSTQIVRDCLGLGLQEDGVNIVELPAHLTKQTVYKRICKESGWDVRITGKGTFKLSKIGNELCPICVWSTFPDYWDRKSPS